MGRKTLILLVFSTMSMALFAQYPSIDNEKDSISIKASGLGTFSELEISFAKGVTYLKVERINKKNALKMRLGDTTITLENLYEIKDTIIDDALLHNNFRSRAYHWIFSNNVSEIDLASEYTELGLIKICIEVWISDFGADKKVLERCYYRTIRGVNYNWQPDFNEFYKDILEMYKFFQ